MIHRILLATICLLPLLCFGQEEKQNAQPYQPGDFFITLNSGVSVNFNAYRQTISRNGDYSFDSEGPRYNIGLGVGIMASKHWRPRLELRYERLAYKQNWLTNTSLYASSKYSNVRLNYLDLNVHFDYLLFQTKNHWTVFASPAIKTEYQTGVSYKTIFNDGSSSSDSYKQIDDFYPNFDAGGAFSFIFKYELSPSIGLTFTPEYTYFFRKFELENSSAYQRLNFNFGAEFRFK